jgi:CRP-like cAMP-binding protein
MTRAATRSNLISVSPVSSVVRPENRLLAALPADEYERLSTLLELVRFPKKRILFEVGDSLRYAYFLKSGMASLLAITEDGQTIEIGTVGSEGFIGDPIIHRVGTTPYRVMVQIPLEAFRIEAKALLAQFNQGGKLQEVLLRYTHVLYVQAAQSAVCNRFHTVQDRLCRWLLVTSECLHRDAPSLSVSPPGGPAGDPEVGLLPFRQEHIANMLGHQRHRISLAARALLKKGLIDYTGGHLKLLDRAGLEASACECYGIVKELIDESI